GSNVLTLATVPLNKGGTGLAALGSANQIFGMNNAGTAGEYKTITAGSGVSVTHGANSITIAATGGTGTVTNVSSANSDIGVATGSTTPVLTLNSGTGNNQIVKLDGTARLPAVDGSNLTNLSAAQITAGTLPVSRGGTGITSIGNFMVMATNGSGVVTPLAGSVNGSMLQYSVTGPVYTTASYPATTTANQLLYSSANNVVGGLGTANNSVLTTNGSGVPSWGALSADSFTQYALLAGRAGGQNLRGGTAANENLTLDSTSNAIKGSVILQPAGGNVGINMTSPRRALSVADGFLQLVSSSTGYLMNDGGIVGFIGSRFVINNLEADAIAFGTNGGSERMRIESGGNVGIGTTAPSELLEVSGNVKATSFISTSDRRLKTNIEASPGLEKILQLQGVQYDWKANGVHEYGVIAQDVEKVFPALVVTDQKTGFKAVKYQGLIAPLIEATKEINARCEMTQNQSEMLAKQLQKVEADVDGLKRKLASVEEENANMKKLLHQMDARMKKLEQKSQP
ncbi:MAG: tail fiber domain-containing protein, partial [Bdellovibrio sp.]